MYELARWAIDNEITLEALQIQRPSLEDIYLQLTGGVHS